MSRPSGSAVQVMNRARRRADKYGLTLEQLDDMIATQEGRCAICRRQYTRRAILARSELVIDHHHGKHHVRGLLCSGCNTGLGFFRDRPDLLREAAYYLELPPAEALRRKWRDNAAAAKAAAEAEAEAAAEQFLLERSA